MSTEPIKLNTRSKSSKIQQTVESEGILLTNSTPTDATLHHVYDTDITATSLFTSDETMAISRPRSSAEIVILAQVPVIEENLERLGGNPEGINLYSQHFTSTSSIPTPTNFHQQAAPSDRCVFPITDVISTPTNTELPYTLQSSTESNYKVINVYSASIQGLGNTMQSIHSSFSCLTDELGTVHLSETTTLMMTILSSAVNIRNWQILGPKLQNYQYYQEVKETLLKLSQSTFPSYEFMQHCKWDSLSSSNPIVTAISRLNSCTSLVLDYAELVQDSMSLSQVPTNLVNFLQKRLHSSVMATPILHVDRRTIKHLPPMVSNVIIHIANCYKLFMKYANQPTYVDSSLSRWTSADIVPVHDVDNDFSFSDIIASVYNGSTHGFDKFTQHLFNVIKLYQLSCIQHIFPVDLIRTIRQLTLLLEWMCQQVTLVSVLQDDSEPIESGPMYLIVKTHTMYHRYDYFLVLFLTMLDATSLVVDNPVHVKQVHYTVPIVDPSIIHDMVEDDTHTIDTADSDLSYGLFTRISKRIQPTLVRAAGPSPVIFNSIGLAGGESNGNPPLTKLKPNALAGETSLVDELKKQQFCQNFSGDVDVVVSNVIKRHNVTFSPIIDDSTAVSKPVITDIMTNVDFVVPNVTQRNAVPFSAKVVEESTAAPNHATVPEVSVVPVIYGRNRGYVRPMVEAPVTVPVVPSMLVTPRGYPIPPFLQGFHATLHPSDPAYFVWSLVDSLIQQKFLVANQVNKLPNWLFVSSLLDAFGKFLDNQKEGDLTVPLLYKAVQDNYLSSVVEVLVGPANDDTERSMGFHVNNSHIELYGDSLCLKPHAFIPKHTCLIYIGTKVTVESSEQFDQLLDAPFADKLLELDTGNKFIAGSDRYLSKANTNLVDPSMNKIHFDAFTRFGLMTVVQDMHGGELGAPVWVLYAIELKGFVFYNTIYIRQLVILSNVLQRYYTGIEAYLVKHKPGYQKYTFQELFTTASDYIEHIAESSAAIQREFLNQYLLPLSRKDAETFSDKERIIAAYIGLLDNKFADQLDVHFPNVHYHTGKHNSMVLKELPLPEIPFYLFYAMAADCKFTVVHSKGISTPYEHPIISNTDYNVTILVAIDPDGEGFIHTHEKRIKQSIANYQVKGDSISGSSSSGSIESPKYSRTSPSSHLGSSRLSHTSDPLGSSRNSHLGSSRNSHTSDQYRSPLRKTGPNPTHLYPIFDGLASNEIDDIDSREPALVPNMGRTVIHSPARNSHASPVVNPASNSHASPVVNPASIVSGQSGLRAAEPSLSLASLTFNATGFNSEQYLDQSLPTDAYSYRIWNKEIGEYPTTGPLSTSRISSIGVGFQPYNYYTSLQKIIGQELPQCSDEVYNFSLMYGNSVQGHKFIKIDNNTFLKSEHSSVSFNEFFIPDSPKHANFAAYIRYTLFRIGSSTSLVNMVQALMTGSILRVQDREVIVKIKRDFMTQSPTGKCTITTVFGEQLPNLYNIRLLKHMLVHLLIWYLNHFDGIRTPESIYKDINILVIDKLEDILLVYDKLTHYHNILGYTDQTLSLMVDTIQKLIITGTNKEPMATSMRQLTLMTLQEKTVLYDSTFVTVVNALPLHSSIPDQVLAQLKVYRQIISDTVEQMAFLVPNLQTNPFSPKERPTQTFKISRPALNTLVDYSNDESIENLTEQEHQELVDSVMKVYEYKSEHLINAIGVLSAKLNIDFTNQYVKRICSHCGQEGHDNPNCRRRSINDKDLLSAQAYQWMPRAKMEEALDAARTRGVLKGTSIEDIRALVEDILKMKADKDQKRAAYAKAPQYGPGGGSHY